MKELKAEIKSLKLKLKEEQKAAKKNLKTLLKLNKEVEKLLLASASVLSGKALKQSVKVQEIINSYKEKQ